MNDIQAGAGLSLEEMRKWFKSVDRLKALANIFDDESAIKETEQQIERMNWVYKVLTGDHSPAVIKGSLVNLAL